VILRIGQLCGSDYEWHQHESAARAIGMDEATLQAVADGAYDRLTEAQQAAVAIAEEIKRESGASEATIARARHFFNKEELVELILCSGFYIMTAGLLLSLDIEIEDTPPLGESI
jgi:alkylhydroperoxidase family enzyme